MDSSSGGIDESIGGFYIEMGNPCLSGVIDFG